MKENKGDFGLNIIWFIIIMAIIVLFGLIFWQTGTVFKKSCEELVKPLYVQPIGEIKHTNINENLDSSYKKENNVITVGPQIVIQVDSMNKVVNTLPYDYLDHSESFINNIRQETNNNLDKLSAWLSFWIAVVALLGVFVPFSFQFFVYKRDEEKLRSQKKELDILRKQYEIEIAKLNIRLFVMNYISVKEQRFLTENFENDDIWNYTCNNISRQLNKIHHSYNDDNENMRDILLPIYSCLLSLLSFAKINSTTSRYRTRQMEKVCDYIRKKIQELITRNITEDIDWLQSIKDLKKYWDVVSA